MHQCLKKMFTSIAPFVLLAEARQVGAYHMHYADQELWERDVRIMSVAGLISLAADRATARRCRGEFSPVPL